MTLKEYITAEFGLIPDEVQLEQIRELAEEERLDRIIEKRSKKFPEPLPKYCKVNNKEYCFLHNQCQDCTDNNSIK